MSNTKKNTKCNEKNPTIDNLLSNNQKKVQNMKKPLYINTKKIQKSYLYQKPTKKTLKLYKKIIKKNIFFDFNNTSLF